MLHAQEAISSLTCFIFPFEVLLEQTVLYLLVKEFFKNLLLKKSYE
jgi:hypothetical protein